MKLTSKTIDKLSLPERKSECEFYDDMIIRLAEFLEDEGAAQDQIR